MERKVCFVFHGAKRTAEDVIDVGGTEKQARCGRGPAYRDVTGQRFGRLTAIYPLPGRDDRGSKLWRCRCDCGAELDVPYNTLLFSNTRSCGCRRKEHEQALGSYLSRVAGTSIDHLKSKKIPTNNTTGVRGVYLSKTGKYVARIVFQKKQYWLGAYATLPEAAAARREAEAALNDQVTAYYAKWKARADADPRWAEENPVQIAVERSGSELSVTLLPPLD